MNQTSKVIEEI